jgi:hypothetical protein
VLLAERVYRAIFASLADAAYSEKTLFDKPEAQQRSCAMTAAELQDKLADLVVREELSGGVTYAR